MKKSNLFNKKKANAKGNLAESMTHVLLSRFNASYEVHKIGGKWPSIDLYVEIDSSTSKPFFFVQVKSTAQARQGKSKKLKVQVSKTKLNRLSQYKAPTYLIGVDFNNTKPTGISFITVIRGKYTQGMGVMPTTAKYELTTKNLDKLKDEVIAFWKSTKLDGKNNYSSNFIIK